MTAVLWKGLLLPLLGTTLGSTCVFLFGKRQTPGIYLQHALNGLAGGVMVAASVWSLLLPSLDTGGLSAALIGFFVGILFLWLLDRLLPEKDFSQAGKDTTLTALAITIHNLPEGMAVGVALAGVRQGIGIGATAAVVLALGIAIQNIPEGAIVSLPLRASGYSKTKSFLYGVLSGVIEPLGALLTLLAAEFITGLLPYLLSFAAGAMVYVVPEELLDGNTDRAHVGTLSFAVGFALMMSLDVLLG